MSRSQKIESLSLGGTDLDPKMEFWSSDTEFRSGMHKRASAYVWELVR